MILRMAKVYTFSMFREIKVINRVIIIIFSIIQINSCTTCSGILNEKNVESIESGFEKIKLMHLIQNFINENKENELFDNYSLRFDDIDQDWGNIIKLDENNWQFGSSSWTIQKIENDEYKLNFSQKYGEDDILLILFFSIVENDYILSKWDILELHLP